MKCWEWVLDAHRIQAEFRHEYTDWESAERVTVCVAANEWAIAHGIDRRITVADLERIETVALGHVDYMQKLALRVERFMETGE